MTEQSWPYLAQPPDEPSIASIESEDGAKVVKVQGEVDAYSAHQLRACLDEVAETPQQRIVVDVNDVGFIDSSGVGVLVASVKRLRQDGRALVVRRPTRQISKLLEITGLRHLVLVD